MPNGGDRLDVRFAPAIARQLRQVFGPAELGRMVKAVQNYYHDDVGIPPAGILCDGHTIKFALVGATDPYLMINQVDQIR